MAQREQTQTCKGVKKDGNPCRMAPLADSEYCRLHQPPETPAAEEWKSPYSFTIAFGVPGAEDVEKAQPYLSRYQRRIDSIVLGHLAPLTTDQQHTPAGSPLQLIEHGDGHTEAVFSNLVNGQRTAGVNHYFPTFLICDGDSAQLILLGNQQFLTYTPTEGLKAGDVVVVPPDSPTVFSYRLDTDATENEIPFDELMRLVAPRSKSFAAFLTGQQSDKGDGAAGITEKDSITLPVSDMTEIFKVYTGQEVHDWMTAQADGRTFAHWFFDEQAGEARHKRPDSNFTVLIRERKDLDPVDALIRKQDANTGLAALYVLGVMEIAKYGPLPSGATYTARIDLLDVAKKSGMITRQGKHEREQARERVWGLMQFGARAEVTGARSTTYYDPDTGKTIPTRLGGSSLWSLQSIEYPDEHGRDEQQKLFPLDNIPLRVRVTLNKDWEPFLFGAHLPQYLRFGEKIGAIPAGKPSGAWAQAMSLCYLHWARVFPREAKEGEAPTRRELLTKYPPAVGSMDEVSSYGRNQRRIVETYLQALEIMAEEGIIARAGDVLTTAGEQLHGFPRKGWIDPWLDASANIKPGAEILQSIEIEILPNLPPERPRILKGAGGRPRKRPGKGTGV